MPTTAEYAMTRAALRIVAPLAVVAPAVAYLVRGTEAAVTALGGVVLVAVWFALSGLSLAWAARRSLAVLQAVALGGFATRVGGMAVLMVTLGPVAAIDGPSLAVTVAVGVVALLAYEVRFVLRTAEFWWVSAETKEIT